MERSRWSFVRTQLVLGASALLLAAMVLVYRGPGQPIVRGHAGDVAATMLVYSAVSLVRPTASKGVRALVTMAIATGIEVAQAWFHARSTVGHLVIGSTFDPIDLVAYVAGVWIAVVWEQRAGRS